VSIFLYLSVIKSEDVKVVRRSLLVSFSLVDEESDINEEPKLQGV
jgi:hypothetical protein